MTVNVGDFAQDGIIFVVEHGAQEQAGQRARCELSAAPARAVQEPLELRSFLRFVEKLEVIVDDLLRFAFAEASYPDPAAETAEDAVIGRNQSGCHNEASSVQQFALDQHINGIAMFSGQFIKSVENEKNLLLILFNVTPPIVSAFVLVSRNELVENVTL